MLMPLTIDYMLNWLPVKLSINILQWQYFSASLENGGMGSQWRICWACLLGILYDMELSYNVNIFTLYE